MTRTEALKYLGKLKVIVDKFAAPEVDDPEEILGDIVENAVEFGEALDFAITNVLDV